MKRLLLLTVLAVGAALSVQAQTPCSQGQPYRGCKACGSAKSAKGQNLNVLKKLGLHDSDYAAMKKAVADQIVGKRVKFEGWMLSDSFHVSESKNTAKPSTPTCQDNGSDPKPCVWRATTWEVHPVTKFTVVGP